MGDVIPAAARDLRDLAVAAGWTVTLRYLSPAWVAELRPPSRGGRPSRRLILAELRPRPTWQVVAVRELIEWGPGRVTSRRVTQGELRWDLRADVEDRRRRGIGAADPEGAA